MSKMFSLENRVALVTGASRGLGLAMAKALKENGAHVIINARDAAALATAAKSIGAQPMAFDVSDAAVSRKALEDIEREHGHLDILVNNAGIQHVAPLAEFPVESWDRIVAINLTAAFHTMRAAIPGMTARGWGRIVNVASAHGLVASPFKSAYVAAKHGLVGLTKVAALELAESGVTCNAVCPGYVWTPLVERQIDDQARAHGIGREQVVRDVLLKNQPTKRFATVEELGALAVFLCSPGAASITGTALPVDGGWTAH